jgi:mono/diheme cytochrome c family protein
MIVHAPGLASLVLLAAVTTPAPSPAFRWRSGGPQAGVPRQRRPAAGPALIGEGAALYQRTCATCHGAGGRGDGIISSHLQTPPRDFTAGVFKVRSTPSGSLPTDLDLFGTLSRGLHGTDMAPWVALSEHERWALVEYLKSLSPRFRAETPEPALAVPAPPPGRAGLRRRGETLYWQLQCRNCHGDAGRGDGPGVREYASEGTRVRIRDLGRADFMRGDSPKDIFLTLRTGMDGTPMAAYDLPAADLWGLAFYVSDVLRRPPAAEPPSRAEAPGFEASH